MIPESGSCGYAGPPVRTRAVPGACLDDGRAGPEDRGMAGGSGRGLMTAGLIVAFIGLCIVLIKVLRVPEYWVPLLVGVGLFLLGFIRWMTSRDS